MRRLPLVTGLAVLALLLLPAAAPAKDVLKFFHTPSGNIGCLYAKVSGSRASLRCDVSDVAHPAPKPASCQFDYGHSFGVSTKGRARRLCVSDAVNDPSSPVLRYGTTRSFGPFTCTSRTSGLRCTAPSGHGFKLSRAKQKLF
jgi:hypothetical protein